MNISEDKNSKKFSKAALVPGNLVWKPVKFKITYGSGDIIVEVNTSNRTKEEQNQIVLDEARRVLNADDFKTITSIEQIPLFPR